jgi:hypothetical protein
MLPGHGNTFSEFEQAPPLDVEPDGNNRRLLLLAGSVALPPDSGTRAGDRSRNSFG